MVIYCGIGPLVSALLHNYGARFVVMLGSTLIAVGTFSSAYVPSITYLYFTFSVVNGVVLGLLYQTAAVLCSSYFKERRGRVNGIVASGSGFGLVIFPPLMTYLLDSLGFIGTFYMLAGVALQGLICGSLIIPPEKALRMKEGVKKKAVYAGKIIEKVAMNTKCGNEIEADAVIDKALICTQNINYIKCQDKTFVRLLPLKLVKILHQVRKGVKAPTLNFVDKLKCLVKSSVDVKLLQNPSYVLYSVSSSLWFVSFVTPLVFIPDRAISFGISRDMGALLISWLGVANMLGRIVFGFVIDLPIVREHRLYLYSFSFIACGVATIINFGTSLHHQIIYSVVYGTFLGCTVSLRCTLLADLIGVEKLSTGFGMMSVLDAVGVFLGPASAGWVYDATQDFNSVFMYSGVVFLLNALVILLIPLTKKLKAQQKSKVGKIPSSAGANIEKITEMVKDVKINHI